MSNIQKERERETSTDLHYSSISRILILTAIALAIVRNMMMMMIKSSQCDMVICVMRDGHKNEKERENTYQIQLNPNYQLSID